MNRIIIAALFCVSAAATTNAQTAPSPLAPPTSPTPVPASPSPLSPILTNPGLALQPYRPGGAGMVAPSPSPLNQQQMQSYRTDLYSRQRVLDQQGISPGSEQYRDIQQQLNQLNSGR